MKLHVRLVLFYKCHYEPHFSSPQAETDVETTVNIRLYIDTSVPVDEKNGRKEEKVQFNRGPDACVVMCVLMCVYVCINVC